MLATHYIAIPTALALSGWLVPLSAYADGVMTIAPPAQPYPYGLAPGEQYITGKIVHVDSPKDASGTKHDIARIRTDSNTEVIVDLGSHNALHGLDLGTNDRVRVVAVYGQFKGEPMIVADRVTDKDGKVAILSVAPPAGIYPEVIRIERPEPTAAMPATPVPAGEVRTIEGQVVQAWTADAPGRGVIQLVRVQTFGGTVTVDLGLQSNLPQGVNLAPGSWVQVSGQFTGSGGQQVLMADTLTRSLRIAR